MIFDNKVVLITGASAGIGEAAALLFAEKKASLALVGRDEGRLRDVAKRCSELTKDPLTIVADLATDEGVEKVVKQVLDKYGRLDVLVNNAGIGSRTTIERTDMAIFDRVFSVNVRGVYNLTRLLVPVLIETKGCVVNVSSISGSMVAVGCLPYSMSKAALDHFTKLVALELAPKGVRVNAVIPGVTVSRFVKTLTGCGEEEYQSWLEEAAKGIPAGRVATAEEVARAILYLASEDSEYITGAVLPVDGGLLLSGMGNSDFLKKQVK